MEFLNFFWLFADGGPLRSFAWGAIMMACLAIALYFIRFWRQTSDRLFLIFGIAFFFLALERIVLATIDATRETTSFIFLIRLLAFFLIITAIVDKNRAGRGA